MKLTKQQLEMLPTKRLLSYKKKYYPHRDKHFIIHEGEGYSASCDCHICLEETTLRKEYIDTYEFIKNILSKREHITK